jgi:putative membrane protein
MFIVVILVGVLVYYTFNANNSNNNHGNNSNTRNYPTNLGTSNANHPLDILNERFAKGDIDEEEYLKKKDILNK